ncbi:hypothetical protein D9619_001147 [Psilocybe cf. subviscida]|uniref:F-box domain-containing protein n=1 Tax=Psilocybe cf. subviscida TaxID=2480587 RepID=A0A8H5BG02_9AGAR|nr:hypothetical protein D9619_001147 [Psilocybe cf. subviscida]
MDFTKLLPPEIFSEIFQWLHLSSVELARVDPSLDERGIQQLWWPVLSQVCRYWREVVLASPFLWSYLPRIDLTEHPLSNALSPKEQLDAITGLVTRAQTTALHVDIVFDYQDIYIHHPSKALTYLLSCSNQWGGLSITAPPEIIETLLELVQGQLSRLESLKLMLLADDAPSYEPRMPLNNAPMLKNVTIKGGILSRDYRLSLDTRSLECLQDEVGTFTRSITPTPGFEFSKLTHLEILSDHGILAVDWDDTFRLTLPALKSLKYKFFNVFDRGKMLLMYLMAPLLEHLAVSTSGFPNIATVLISMNERTSSGLPLTSLHIGDISGFSSDDSEGMEMVLRQFPDLETLEVDVHHQGLISALSDSIQGPNSRQAFSFVPRLKKLTLRNGNLDYVNAASVAKLVKERCECSAVPGCARKNQTSSMFELSIHVNGYYRETPGFGNETMFEVCLGVRPTKLEPWYDEKRVLQSAYAEATQSIYIAGFLAHDDDLDEQQSSSAYKDTLGLIERVAERYNSAELVDFLATNVNIRLITMAYFLRKDHPDTSKNPNSRYRQIIRLLRAARQDILDRLKDLSFQWIWESSSDNIRIRYVHSTDEMRTDPERFANAILGITKDLWVLDNF